MSGEANTALARRFFEDFSNGRRAELAAELMTADYAYHDPQIPGVHGPQGYAQAIAVFQDGVGAKWEIQEIIPAGSDRVVVRWAGVGVHTAELMGIPATGKAIRVAAISILRIEGGKIAEHWCVWDTLGLLQQLGVAPMPEAVAA